MVELLIKIAMLATWVGGPLYCTDLYKAEWGQLIAFVVFFTPSGLMAWAALFFRDEVTAVVRGFLWLGVLSGVFVIVVDGAVAAALLGGAVHPDASLIWTGIVVGTPVCVVYIVVVVRRLLAARRRAESAAEQLED